MEIPLIPPSNPILHLIVRHGDTRAQGSDIRLNALSNCHAHLESSRLGVTGSNLLTSYSH